MCVCSGSREGDYAMPGWPLGGWVCKITNLEEGEDGRCDSWFAVQCGEEGEQMG